MPFALLIPALLQIAVVKFLLSIGVGIISFAGLVTVMNQVISIAQSNYEGMAPDLLNFLNLAGAGTAFGIIFGAFIARLSYVQLKRIGFTS